MRLASELPELLIEDLEMEINERIESNDSDNL